MLPSVKEGEPQGYSPSMDWVTCPQDAGPTASLAGQRKERRGHSPYIRIVYVDAGSFSNTNRPALSVELDRWGNAPAKAPVLSGNPINMTGTAAKGSQDVYIRLSQPLVLERHAWFRFADFSGLRVKGSATLACRWCGEQI